MSLKSPRRLRMRAAHIRWIVCGSWGVLGAGACSDDALPAPQPEAGAGGAAENQGAAGSGGTETGTDRGSDSGDAGSTTDVQQPSMAVGKDGTALVARSQFHGATDNVVLAKNSGCGPAAKNILGAAFTAN